MLARFPSEQAGAVGYSTVAAFKGMEAPAVVLTDIFDLSRPESANLLYVAASRATDRLHILVSEALKPEMKKLLSFEARNVEHGREDVRPNRSNGKP